ncbi:pilus assembly protein N-terminal domain-containing protein [Litorimonas sp. WD9-15]|uniref:pilus assembly protein N-terminal domain-containing protein n=1 Tax=Litorimonas sp. WD9-15 TaxID=3418716 RepID=UPI003CFBC89D
MRMTKLLLVLATIASSAAPAFAGDQVYKVELNKTEVVRLPGAASSIIIGNPNIADVTVQSVDTIFVVGRGYGETNLIILDANGNTMMDTNLQVVNTLSSHSVRLHNAKSRETYSCIPYCGPSPVLGDNPEFIALNTPEDRDLDTTIAQGPSLGGTGASVSDGSNIAGGAEFSSPTGPGF